jgi:DNA-binding transcriptional LysR family regulator
MKLLGEMTMEMLQLRYFYESAMAESFSRTARNYMVPVSSVSASVKRLEQELGVELFARTGNRIRLTEKGKQFLSVVEESLLQLDTGINRLRSTPAEEGTLTILARCTRETLTHHIMRFHQAYPSVLFKVVFEDLSENYDHYDLIISEPDKALGEYLSFPWRRFAVRIEAVETDPICHGTITLSQLRDRLFVTTGTQRAGFKFFAQACKQQGFTPKVLLECDDYNCWGKALRTGSCLGVAIGNEKESRSPGLRYLSVSDFSAEYVSNVYYKKEKYQGNVKLFVDFLETVAWK